MARLKMFIFARISSITFAEEDDYKQCAGDALRKCIISGETVVEQKIASNFFTAMKNYIKCFEEERNTCGVPILQHFTEHLQVYGKYMDAKHGEFGKLVEKISFPL